MDLDYAVIGAGINGTCAAMHLADRGHRTVLIDQFPLPHSRGSSHGQSRLIRKGYPEPHIRAMVDDAYNQWHKIEKETGTKLMNNVGSLNYGDRRSKYISEVASTFRAKGGNYRFHDGPRAISKAFPALRITDENMFGIFDEDGGVIMADKALEAARSVAVKRGCTVLDNFPVAGITSNGPNAVSIEDEDGRVVRAKGVVVCAGPWTEKILKPMGFSLPLTPIVVPVFYWRKKTPTAFPKCCVIYDFSGKEDINYIYSTPELEYPGMAKICSHQGVAIRDPDLRDSVDVSKVTAVVANIIKKQLPGMETKPAIVEKCIYTVTPDHKCILDWHPEHRNIVVGAGFSGTGFKLGPVTGEILAEMVLSGRCSRFDIQHFKANRFNNGRTKKSKL